MREARESVINYAFAWLLGVEIGLWPGRINISANISPSLRATRYKGVSTSPSPRLEVDLLEGHPADVELGSDRGAEQGLCVRRGAGLLRGVRQGLYLCLFAGQSMGQGVDEYLCWQGDPAASGVVRRAAGLFPDLPSGGDADPSAYLCRHLLRHPFTGQANGRHVYPDTGLPLSRRVCPQVGLDPHIYADRRGDRARSPGVDRYVGGTGGRSLCRALGRLGSLVTCGHSSKMLCRARDLKRGRVPSWSVRRPMCMDWHRFTHRCGCQSLCQSHGRIADLTGGRSVALPLGTGVGQQRGRPATLPRCPQVTRCQGRQTSLYPSRVPGGHARVPRQMPG